jgi:hypothetical protein
LKTQINEFEGYGIVAISGANDSEDFVGNAGELFVGGICPACRHGIGDRTEMPLVTSCQLPADSDGGFVRIRIAGPHVTFSIYIFSSDFMAILSAEERRQFKWLPVKAGAKSKKSFFEPVSRALMDEVVPKGLFSESERLQPDGFHCQKCGRKTLCGIPQGGGGIYTFVSEADLPESLPTCFQIGQSGNLTFCMTKKRWKMLAGKQGTKRLMSRQVGIVKANKVNPNPLLETDMVKWWQ